jgi:subtilisin family serine protease
MPGLARLRRRFHALLVPGALLVLSASTAGAQARARVLDLPLYEPEAGRTRVPAYHARKIVLEMAPGTPRPGFGRLARPGALPQRLASSGLAGLDAVHAAHGVVVYEPLFPQQAPPPAGSSGEDLTRFYVVELPAGGSLAAALADYAAAPGVAGAEPVGIMPVSYVPNDPGRVNQWQLGQPSDRDSDVYEAWDVSRGDTTVVVGIIDTGVQYSHADLGGPAPHTGGNIAHNWIEMGGAPGVDDDGNGFVDDFRGWDFVSLATGVPGEDLSGADNDPKDFVGHGTFCAGMASARTDNGTGIAGTGFRTKILPLRVGWANAPGGAGVVDMSWAAQALTYAGNNGVEIVNCSWQSSNLSALVTAATFAIGRGVTIVVAAGNENTDIPPQNYLATRGDCVDVAATTSNDERAGFSNFGAWVDASAAGSFVYSTYSNMYTNTYATGDGTSYAAPFVAGALGLWQGHRRSLGLPQATPTEALLRVRDTGDDIDLLNGGYAGMLGSRLNVHRLLTDPPTSWANVGPGGFTTSPAIVDLDGDGDEEVVIGATDQRLVAVTGADGDTMPGFPVLLTGAINSSPAIWDVDLDGTPEILVATSQGRVYAVRGNGTIVPGWPVLLSGDLRAGPAIADLDPTNPGLELVIGSSNGSLWVLDRTGAIRPGWPQAAGDAIYATPALHDFDGDGTSEIIVGAFDSTLYGFRGDGSPMPGWPVALPDRVLSSAAIGDVDRDGAADIVVGCYDQKVYALHADATPLAGWPVTVVGAVRSSPALADLRDGDGWVEVAIASDGPTLYVIDHQGNFAPGWPQALGGSVTGGVNVADVDGDGVLDVIAGASDRTLNVYSAFGQQKVGWPRTYDGVISGTPSIGDPDDDGRAEIVFGTESRRLRAVDMGPGSWTPGLAPWPTMHRDLFRRGSLSSLVVGVGPVAGSVTEGTGLSFRATPNPAASTMRLVLRRPSTAAAATAAADAAGADAVRIYTVAGRLVRTLPVPPTAAAEVAIAWDGADDGGRPVSTGLYFAHARWGGSEARLRLVRLP